jgi:hypothetical protein
MPEFREEIGRRLSGLKLAPTREAEIIEELSQHLEDQYEQSLSHGATDEEAHRSCCSPSRCWRVTSQHFVQQRSTR